MCGIAGIFAYGEAARPVDEAELLRIREHMLKRGPDGAGLWMSPDHRVGLAHRRLAIIDLSEAGAQPMATADGRLQITFNGEIYNYRELRRELEGKGFVFRTNSDTEVLLHLYAERGANMMHALRGMYAFGIWDNPKRELFLARDPFGIKPLYFADNGSTLRFSSQVKALLNASSEIDTRPAAAGHVGYFVLGSVPEPLTLYRGVRQLLAGSTMCVRRDREPQQKVYFDVTRELADAERDAVIVPAATAGERLRELLVDSVQHHMVSDVEVGLFLSSGVDSALIAAATSNASLEKLRAITLGFQEYKNTPLDETLGAREVASRLGFDHLERWISNDHFSAIESRVLKAMDQPSNDGVNTYLISKEAAACGLKVALSGLGADEFLQGYPSFRQVPRLASVPRIFRSVGLAVRHAVARVSPASVNPKLLSFLEYAGSVPHAYLLRRALFLPWELESLLDRDLLDEGLADLQLMDRLRSTVQGIRSSNLQVCALETTWYMRNQLLRDADWAGMSHSLEIRVPFIDVPFFRGAVRLHAEGRGSYKHLAVRAFGDQLPHKLLTRRKTGFSVPVRAWSGDATQGRGLRGWATTAYERSPDLHDSRSPSLRQAIAVFRTGQLGDVLAVMPAIERLRRRYRCRPFVFVHDIHSGRGYVSAVQVLEPTGWFRKILNYEARGTAPLMAWRALALAAKLRRLNVWAVYDFSSDRTLRQYARNERFFTLICGVKRYVNGAREQALVGRGVDRRRRIPPEWQFWIDVAGVGDEQGVFQLPIPASAREEADNALAGRGASAGRVSLLALAPGSKMQAKTWPLERYVDVCRRLLAEHSDLRVLVLGGIGERGLGDALEAALGPRIVNLAGELTVYGSAAVLQKCVAYLGSDSGAMHLAAYAGVPCVAIFSARDHPGLWEPYGSGHLVLRRDVPCSGCMLEICTENARRCLTEISVQDVHDAVKGLLLNSHNAKDAC